MKSKLRPHLFTHDQGVPPDAKGHRWCTCGAPEHHERHTLPSAPAQADHRHRYDHSDQED